jgi:hypothetical protein
VKRLRTAQQVYRYTPDLREATWGDTAIREDTPDPDEAIDESTKSDAMSRLNTRQASVKQLGAIQRFDLARQGPIQRVERAGYTPMKQHWAVQYVDMARYTSGKVLYESTKSGPASREDILDLGEATWHLGRCNKLIGYVLE